MNSEYEVLKYARDKHPESHIHEFYEIFVSLSNNGKFFVKEVGYDLHFGDVFFLEPCAIHRCFCHGDQEYNRYVIHFTRGYLQSISTEKTDLVACFNSAPIMCHVPDDALLRSLGHLTSLLNPVDDCFGADIERNNDFNDFLLAAARRINGNKPTASPVLERDKRVSEILQYIHEHFEEDITLEDLSRTFFVSKSRLSQIFKNATGFSVGDYIITYRLKRACTLLSKGVSVQEVGEQVGFHNSSHFIRMFKKHTGSSPGKFARGGNT